MNYFFPIHLDGGNRGCEAIAKSSAILLGVPAGRQFGYCCDMALDTELGIPKYLTLIPRELDSYVVDRCLAIVNRLFHTPKIRNLRMMYPYRSLLRHITTADVVLFTGGDMMCYDDNEIIYLNRWLHQQGVKTILWGCSMGPENMTKEKRETLDKFSLIYTRESLTYEYFQSLGLQNLYLFPDPAFILPAEPWPLPPFFEAGNLIGLNISNYVMGGMTLRSRFGQEVIQLITHIIETTNLNILLLPHVTWKFDAVNQDDREMCCLLHTRFNHSERMSILDIDHLNYAQIRYAISRCKAFIGARTHAVISAYSMCIPTIALGYSIKSRGIARDLDLPERLVVNSKDFSTGDLLRSFHYLMSHLDEVRTHLSDVIPAYCQLPYEIRNVLSSNFLSPQ